MNIEEYISSGILELYVSGSLSEDESREVVAMAKKYPELRAEIASIEAAFGMLSSSLVEDEPSMHILENALKDIQLEEESRSIHPMSSRPSFFSRALPWAASVLLFASIIFNIFQFVQQRSLSKEVAELELMNLDLQEQSRNIGERLAVYEDRDVRTIYLNELDVPNSSSIIYLNTKTLQAYLNFGTLPSPPEGKQYQLWTLDANGAPKSAGILNFETGLLDVGNIDSNAKSLAISLEPAGGSESPTAGQIYVLGSIG